MKNNTLPSLIASIIHKIVQFFLGRRGESMQKHNESVQNVENKFEKIDKKKEEKIKEINLKVKNKESEKIADKFRNIHKR